MLLVAGCVLIGVEIGLRIAGRDASVPMVSAALTCWGLIPAFRHGDKQA